MALRIALAQINSTLGDINRNVKTMIRFYKQAIQEGAQVVVFPELAVCGYPPEDLLLKKHFLEDSRKGIERLAKNTSKTTILAGFPESIGNNRFNSMAVMQKGEINNVYRKGLLPNYGVFDERRYFTAGTEPISIYLDGIELTLTICEDIWDTNWLRKFLGNTRRKAIINISASPFDTGKIFRRDQVIQQCISKFDCAVAYCNSIGGQDELVFDGRSMFVNPNGKTVCQAKAFEEDLLIADLEETDNNFAKITPANSWKTEEISITKDIYKSLVLGTSDYVTKNGFKKVVVGLSGGIDSSLTVAVAVKALGAENVIGVTMPTKFNQPETISDAELQAHNLGIEFHSIPIGDILECFEETLSEVPGWENKGVAHENLQARIRGAVLMSLSNQFGWLVLTTGNKSETAVGYSTLYGDTAGGFAVIKDLHKPMVYELAHYINEISEKNMIPQTILNRQPSAELAENQADRDTLPDYNVLADILKGYVEQNKSPAEIIASGIGPETVNKIIRMVDFNEYKRRQSAPGVKITPLAFGKDRRMPITNRY